MSDRLSELKRQRELLREHAAWLEREIAAEEVRTPSTAAPAATDIARHAPTAAMPPAAPPGDVDVAELARRYGADPTASIASVKRGCWILFVGAFAALGLGIALFWFMSRSR